MNARVVLKVADLPAFIAELKKAGLRFSQRDANRSRWSPNANRGSGRESDRTVRAGWLIWVFACYLAAIESPCVFRRGVHRRDPFRRHGHCRRIRDWQPDDAIARHQIRHHNRRGTCDVAARGGDGRPLLAFARPRGSPCPCAVRPAQRSGALAGALIYTRLGPGALTRVLGGLLLLTAVAQLTGWASRWQPHGPLVALFGLVSGFFGGVAGNQGGLRSAALMAFGLPPLGFVATATATGLLVDAARTPVYLGTRGQTVTLGHPSSSPRSASSSGRSWASASCWDCRRAVSARPLAGQSAHSGSGCS